MSGVGVDPHSRVGQVLGEDAGVHGRDHRVVVSVSDKDRLSETISGPIVLVGHPYGSAVITNAAVGNPNVKALVYVDAFSPTRERA